MMLQFYFSKSLPRGIDGVGGEILGRIRTDQLLISSRGFLRMKSATR